MFQIPNTFGLRCTASAQLDYERDVTSVIDQCRKSGLAVIPVGSASNILFADEQINAVILKAVGTRIDYSPTDNNSVLVMVGAGVSWHDLVLDTLAHDLNGLENLSLIPGTVGAAPIQNIGAYGVEVAELIARVTTLNLNDGSVRHFSRTECEFAYRDSVFKRQFKDQLLITEVQFELSTRPKIRAGYESLADYLKGKNVESLTARDISDAVIAVRRARLPDPEKIGNAGSFFKNPVIAKEQFEQLFNVYPQMPHYPQNKGDVKIAAGWLIDQCGYKGVTRGNAGIHDKQALVLVNRGQASGHELIALAREVKRAVQDRFSISLEHEVRILDRDARDIVL